MTSTTTTVQSDYGPLTLLENTTLTRHSNQLPKLQFDDGDLLIMLGKEMGSWLLLHRAVVQQACPGLRPGLSDEWNRTTKPKVIKHPRTGKEVSVRCLALKCVDNTYLLEGQAVPSEGYNPTYLFCNSELAVPRWPEYGYNWQNLATTQRALRIFFALLYGARLDYRQFSGRAQIEDRGAGGITRGELIATVCGYAEYWACLETVGSSLLQIMKAAPSYWEQVAGQAEYHLLLASKLKDEETYLDAMRGMIANALRHDVWTKLAQYFTSSETELRAFYMPQMEANERRAQVLIKELQKLGLHETRAHFWGRGWETAYTRFLDVLRLKEPHRSESEKFRERPGFSGRSIYSEWLLCTLHGDTVDQGGKHGVRGEHPDGGRLNLAIHKIEEAAESLDPASIFDTATPIHFANIFILSRNERLQLQRCLQHLVRKADDLIKAEYRIEPSWATGGKPSTLRRARHGVKSRSFHTYLNVPDEVPWMTADSTTSSPVPPHITGLSVTDASSQWLEVVSEHYTGTMSSD